MGFNKRYLPDLESLKKIREEMDSDAFFMQIYFYNPDALFGPPGTIKYLEDLHQLMEEEKRNKLENHEDPNGQ